MPDQQKNIDKLKSYGAIFEAFGFLQIIGSVGIFILAKSISGNVIEFGIFTLLIIFLIGIVMLILGSQLRKNPLNVSVIKFYVLGGLSILLFALNVVYKEKEGFYSPLLLLVLSILCINTIKKLHNPKSPTNNLASQNLTGKAKILDLLKVLSVACIVMGVLILIGYLTFR